MRAGFIALVLLGLTGCAGTQPNAIQKGFPKAQLHPLDKIDCRHAALDQDCIDRKNLPIDHRYSGLADDGFRATKTHEAYETQKNRGDR